MLYTLGNWFYDNGALGDQNDRYFLQLFHAYSDEPFSHHFTYQPMDSFEIAKLYRRYQLDQFVEGKSEFRTQCNLMNWVHCALSPLERLHVNDTTPPDLLNTDSIMAFCRNNGISNCFMNSLVLNEVYLAMGYRSRLVICYPMDLRPAENHCITQVYSNEFCKWIIMDAALNIYYLGPGGLPLSIQEMRRLLIEDKKIWIPGLNKWQVENTRKYWYKNIFRYQCDLYSGYDVYSNRQSRTVIGLNPLRYELENTDQTINRNCTIHYVYTHNETAYWK